MSFTMQLIPPAFQARACTVFEAGRLAAVPHMQFTEKKAAGQIRWAVLNVTTLLRRHARTHARLAQAMAAGRSVAECIALIEASAPAEDDEQQLQTPEPA